MASLRNYGIVTGAYWVFTLTDGALRMLVLLHLHALGRSPLEIASLFLFYEFFGVATSFVGAWIGTRFGLKSTLISGLVLQISACLVLAAAANELTVLIVMAGQGNFGAGFFLGALLLSTFGFRGTTASMAAALLVTMIIAALTLTTRLSTPSKLDSSASASLGLDFRFLCLDV